MSILLKTKLAKFMLFGLNQMDQRRLNSQKTQLTYFKEIAMQSVYLLFYSKTRDFSFSCNIKLQLVGQLCVSFPVNQRGKQQYSLSMRRVSQLLITQSRIYQENLGQLVRFCFGNIICRSNSTETQNSLEDILLLNQEMDKQKRLLLYLRMKKYSLS